MPIGITNFKLNHSALLGFLMVTALIISMGKSKIAEKRVFVFFSTIFEQINYGTEWNNFRD